MGNITCKNCVAKDVPEWGNELCITCARDCILPSDNKEQEMREQLWKLFGKREYPNDGRGTVNRFFDDLIPFIADQCRLARRKETKLYEDWCNNHTTTHIEDFIEYRVKSLEEG